MIEGYTIQLSFFIEGQRTFNTLGVSNKIFYESLSGPMVITTSCLKNLIIPRTKHWFGMIVNETGCQINNAIQNITDLGASAAFYYGKNWTHDIFYMKNKNIAIDDVTYSIIQQNNDILEAGIHSNIQSNTDIFLLALSCMMFGFLFYKIIAWCYQKYKKYSIIKTITYHGNGDESCTICIEEFKNGEIVRTLQCNHIFHEKCIDEWFEKKEVCPNCNQPAALTQPLLH